MQTGYVNEKLEKDTVFVKRIFLPPELLLPGNQQNVKTFREIVTIITC